MGSLFPVVQKAIASVEPVEMQEIEKIMYHTHNTVISSFVHVVWFAFCY